jgi:hypothetical protein
MAAAVVFYEWAKLGKENCLPQMPNLKHKIAENLPKLLLPLRPEMRKRLLVIFTSAMPQIGFT